MEITQSKEPAVWFPAIRAGTGTDVFTIRLANALRNLGLRAEIGWLPHRAEYAPWSVAPPKTPSWANITHVNTWLHRKFLPKNLPIVATTHLCVHDPALNPYKRPMQVLYHRYWVKKMERIVLSRASEVVAVSHYTAQQTQRISKRADFHVIYNGVNTNHFQPNFRESPNVPFRLLFVGTLSRRKGADLLPQIMSKLGKEFTLDCIGSSEAGFSMGCLPENITILGRINNEERLINILQSADALLFPTRLEGLPLSVLEAQSCGVPVISTFSSSLPELVENGATGLLCPVNEIASFAYAVKQLANEVAFWRNMCQKAAKRTVRLFSQEVMAQRYIEVYKAALDKLH